MPLRDNLDRPLWTVHSEHDVAVLAVGGVLGKELIGEIAVEVFPQRDHSLTKSEAQSVGVSEGDGVFILGFPVGWKRSFHHYPVVRYGIIAQIRGLFDGWHSTYLVDGSAFGGNSGSPVITKFEVASIRGLQANSETHLIGMVSAYATNPASVDETPRTTGVDETERNRERRPDNRDPDGSHQRDNRPCQQRTQERDGSGAGPDSPSCFRSMSGTCPLRQTSEGRTMFADSSFSLSVASGISAFS